jgi:NTE family protein
MKRAIVLSGGGAKGAFQFGALKYIYENHIAQNPGYKFDIVAGISAGALNGALIAQNKYPELKDIWQNMSNDVIYKGSLKVLPAIWNILLHKTCIMSNEPLRQKLSTCIKLEDVGADKDFRFGAVSLDDGEYYMFRASDFGDDENLRNAILASSAMPGVWPPVKEVRLKSGKVVRNLVDGGIRNSNPLGDVIADNPDEIVIINCNTIMLDHVPDSAKNIGTILKRSLASITINEVFRSDLNEFLRVNQIISQLPENTTVYKNDGRPYKKFNYILLEPQKHIGDPLDFSQKAVDMRIEHGFDVAQKEFSKHLVEL